MIDRSSLKDTAGTLVADTSVVINLIATGLAREILAALPNQIVLTRTVYDEIVKGGRNGIAVSSLIDRKHIEIVQMSGEDLEHFNRLVAGSAALTLDDGEAATIAYAVGHGATALIDEKKAIRICESKYIALSIGSSVDIFMHDSVQNVLGIKGTGDALFMALREANMRVLPQHIDWVVGAIGSSRAAQCDSLPLSVRKRLSRDSLTMRL